MSVSGFKQLVPFDSLGLASSSSVDEYGHKNEDEGDQEDQGGSQNGEDGRHMSVAGQETESY